MKTHPNLVCSIPFLLGSEAKNVIPEQAIIKGTIRYYEDDESAELVRLLEAKAIEVCQKKNFEIKLNNMHCYYPATNNNCKESVEFCRKIVEEELGDGMVTEDGCPGKGSEDFSYFLREVGKGCFMFYNIGGNEKDVTLHSSRYQFDDGCIGWMSNIWFKIFEKRFCC